MKNYTEGLIEILCTDRHCIVRILCIGKWNKMSLTNYFNLLLQKRILKMLEFVLALVLLWESTEAASPEQSLHPPKLLPSPCISPACPPSSPDGHWSSPEADDLAQYLDHLLAQAAPQKPKQQTAGGLGRFKAVVAKTKQLVSLKNKAQELDVHSECLHCRSPKYRMFRFALGSWVGGCHCEV